MHNILVQYINIRGFNFPNCNETKLVSLCEHCEYNNTLEPDHKRVHIIMTERGWLISGITVA